MVCVSKSVRPVSARSSERDRVIQSCRAEVLSFSTPESPKPERLMSGHPLCQLPTQRTDLKKCHSIGCLEGHDCALHTTRGLLLSHGSQMGTIRRHNGLSGGLALGRNESRVSSLSAFSRIIISTLRFFVRPSGVSLVAMGFASAKPVAERWVIGTP